MRTSARTALAVLIATSAAAGGLTATANAADPPLKRVLVRTEGKTKTLFEGPLMTRGHDVTADGNTRDGADTVTHKCDATNNGGSPTPEPTPTASTAEGLQLVGYPTIGGDWYDGFDDYFVTRFGPDKQDESTYAYWGILVNGVYTSVGGCQYPMAEDDEALWVYDAFNARVPLRLDGPEGIGAPTSAAEHTPSVAPVKKVFTVALGAPFTVHVKGFYDTYDPGNWTKAPGIGVSPVSTDPTDGSQTVLTSDPATVNSDVNGDATITWTTPGWKRIKADGGTSTIRSNRLDVCVKNAAGDDCGPLPGDAQDRGIALTPNFDATSADLGTAPQGTLGATRTFTFKNPASNTTIQRIRVTGAQREDFLVSADECTGPLPSGESCTVSVRFAPGAFGARSASLDAVLSGTAGTRSVALSGTGGDLPQGPKGDPGTPAVNGTNGATGAQGIAGPSGPAGPVGPAGPSGPKGDTGANGTDLRDAGVACRTARAGSKRRPRWTTVCAATLTGAKSSAPASLTRGGRVYARGTLRRLTALDTKRRFPRGRYTLRTTAAAIRVEVR
jgi:hypothetical protein